MTFLEKLRGAGDRCRARREGVGVRLKQSVGLGWHWRGHRVRPGFCLVSEALITHIHSARAPREGEQLDDPAPESRDENPCRAEGWSPEEAVVAVAGWKPGSPLGWAQPACGGKHRAPE